MVQTNIMMLGLFSIISLKQYAIPSVYDFNLYQGIFMEKNDLNSPDFAGIFFSIVKFFMISSNR
jgi:hypothetical protein